MGTRPRSGRLWRASGIAPFASLGPRERALPTQLSAGEQQRVGIARALVAEPALLVASHDLGLIKRMRKRVLVLDQGRLADDIAPEELADA